MRESMATEQNSTQHSVRTVFTAAKQQPTAKQAAAASRQHSTAERTAQQQTKQMAPGQLSLPFIFFLTCAVWWFGCPLVNFSVLGRLVWNIVGRSTISRT